MTAQQLKASILQLAIQGKLVPQNPADEPASVLLKKIKAEKDALVKAGKIKKDKHESVIIRNKDGRYLEKKDGKTTDITDEIPFDIPESWEWVRLKTVTSVLGDGIHGTPIFDPNGEVFFINGNNLCNGEIIIKNDTKRVSKEESLKHLRPLQEQTILVSINGTLGNVAFYQNEPVILGKSACYFNLLGNIYKDYIKVLLQTSFFLKYATNKATGSTINNVSLAAMRDFLFPLPPLNEQARIVAKIEELLPHIEEYGKAETALSKLNAELPEQLKKSILQWAIQGRLVPQDPTDEPASELLNHIKAEKAALIKSGKLKKEKPLPPISEDEIPFDIPESWEWVRLGSLGAFGGGKTPSMNQKEFWGGDVLWVTSKDMKTKYIYDTGLKVTNRGAKELQLLSPRTILMVTRSGILKHIFPVAINQKECTINQDLKSLSLFLPSMIEYVYILLKGSEGRILSHYKKKGTTVESIKWDSFINMPLPIPPLAEQKRIVERLENLFVHLNCSLIHDKGTIAHGTK